MRPTSQMTPTTRTNKPKGHSKAWDESASNTRTSPIAMRPSARITSIRFTAVLPTDRSQPRIRPRKRARSSRVRKLLSLRSSLAARRLQEVSGQPDIRSRGAGRAAHGGYAAVVAVRQFLQRSALSVASDGLFLLGVQGGGLAHVLSLGLGSVSAFAGAGADQVALELDAAAENHHHPPGHTAPKSRQRCSVSIRWFRITADRRQRRGGCRKRHSRTALMKPPLITNPVEPCFHAEMC